MSDDQPQEHGRAAEEARRRAQETAARAEERARAQEERAKALTGERAEEVVRQFGLIYAGLIAIAVVLMQGYLEAPALDTSAKISVVAFSVAIPLLAALALVNRAGVLPSPTDAVHHRHHRTGGGPAGCLRRDRRRLLAHPVDRRCGIPRRRARRGGGALRRLCAPGNGPAARAVERRRILAVALRPLGQISPHRMPAWAFRFAARACVVNNPAGRRNGDQRRTT